MWMEECIVSLGQAGLSDELEYVPEGIGHVRSSLIMQVKVQIIQVRMRFSEVIFTRVCNVQDMRDAKCLYDVCIACMMPITEIETTWEDLVWVVISLRRTRNNKLAICVEAVVPVMLLDLVKATDTKIHLTKTFLLKRFKEKDSIPQRQEITLFFISL